MPKAIAYLRLSSEDQSNYSLDGQRRMIKEYCQRNNLELLKVYEDNGESSYTFDRKAFSDLEKEIKQAQYLIVYHLDRFSRNMAEAMLKIKQYLERGIRVRDVSEALDMDDYDPNTFMLRAMKFMVAEGELHRIRQRTKKGVVDAALAGRHSNMAPIGYKNARDEYNKPVILIDDEKAFVIRIVYREFLNGMGIEAIRRLINRYGFDSKGNSKLQYILANPVYAGYVKVPATTTRPAHLVKGIHDPIISEQDYWAVQELLKGKSKNAVQDSTDVPLRGALHCGCGRKLTAGNSKGRNKYYWYYVCLACKTNLSATKLHKQFGELLDNLSLDPKTLKAYKDKMVRKLEDYLANRGSRMKQLQKELTLVESRIESVEKKWLLNTVSENSYNQVIGELRADQSRIYKELTNANTNQQAYWGKLNSFLVIISDLRVSFDKLPLEKKHQFINWVFDNSLSYENDIYRTPYILDVFAHNTLTLKEKGLLEIVAPIRNLNETPNRTRDGSPIEHPADFLSDFEHFIKIFVA